MKKKYYLVFAFIIGFSFISCISPLKKNEKKVIENIEVSEGSDLPQFKFHVTMKSIENLSQLKGSVAVLFVMNYPDAYLVKAKDKIFPIGLAIDEVLLLQEQRNEWLDQAILSACDECKEFETLEPLNNYPEEKFLMLTDRAAKNIDVNWNEVALNAELLKKYKYIWIITGRTDTEQKRGVTDDSNIIGASSFRSLELRSIIFDVSNKSILHASTLSGNDQETILYQKVKGGISSKASKLISRVFKSNLNHDENMNEAEFNSIYPFPLEPDVEYILQKGLNRLAEEINP